MKQAPGAFELRSCLGKVRFPNRRTAKDKAARILQKLGQRSDVYSCDNCRGFHLRSAR